MHAMIKLIFPAVPAGAAEDLKATGEDSMDQSKRPQKYELLGGRNREGKHTGLLGYADGFTIHILQKIKNCMSYINKT